MKLFKKLKKKAQHINRKKPKYFYAEIEGEIVCYEVLKKTGYGFIVIDPETERPNVFHAEFYNEYYFDNKKDCLKKSLEKINTEIKEREDKIKELKK